MPNTVDTITKWLTDQVKAGQPIGPEVWMDAASNLNVLLQEEQEKLFGMEQQVALMRGVLLDADRTVAYAKSKVEETDVYKQMRIQKAKIDRAIELIKISKINSRISRDIMGGQL